MRGGGGAGVGVPSGGGEGEDGRLLTCSSLHGPALLRTALLYREMDPGGSPSMGEGQGPRK